MKKLISLLLALSALCVIHAQTAISNSVELAAISSSGDYYLTADIEVDSWNPIPYFTGTIDGRGHCITLKDSHPDSEGRCGFIITTDGASLLNLFLRGFYHDASSYAGGFVAVANNTTFQNCESGVYLFTESTSAILGGFVGIMTGGTLDNCISCPTLDGYQLGGMVGVLQGNAAIRNGIANVTTIFSFGDHFPQPRVGYITIENYGTIENVYVTQREPDWFLPSIGQLMMMNRVAIFCHIQDTVDIKVLWTNGASFSSTSQYHGGTATMNEDGAMYRNGGASGPVYYLAHDFLGTRYNLGDSLMIGGVPCYVFYINEEGTGGVAATFMAGRRGTTDIVSQTNTGVSNFYNVYKFFSALDFEYAQSHNDFVPWWDETVNSIPEEYYDNPGKYFTYLLRSNESDLNKTINRFEPSNSNVYNNNHFCFDFVRQFAFKNEGQISNCFYSRAVNREKLTNVNGDSNVTGSALYIDLWEPYGYKEFGSFLAKGTTITETSNGTQNALVDNLNAWVSQHPDQGFVYWDNSTSRRVNNCRPILKLDFSDGNAPVNTVVGSWIREDMEFLRYVDINHLPEEYDKNYIHLAYYGSSDSITADNLSAPWNSTLFITEQASLKGDYKLKAYVGITLDNSDASDFAGAKYDWHMVSTPLSNAPLDINYSKYTAGGPTGNPSQVSFMTNNGYFPINTPYTGWDFYCYDEINSGWPNFKRKTNDHYHHETGEKINYVNETNLIPGKGYLMAIDKKTFLQAYGSLNNDTVRYQATHQGFTKTGYNLIGNPYHASLDFDAFFDDNADALSQGSFSILDADHQGYVTYLKGASDNPLSPSRYLHPHQAFFVSVPTDTVLVFTPSQTVVDTIPSFRTYHDNYPLVNLWVTDPQGRNDYVTVETNRPEKGGALKLEGMHAGNAELYASLDKNHYSIAFLETGTSFLPLRFMAYEEGFFTFNWQCLNGFLPYIHLIDHLTGNDIDCLGQQDYVFYASPGDFSSRFLLAFSPNYVQEQVVRDIPFASYYQNTLSIMASGTLDIMDVLGHVIATYQIDSPGTSLTFSYPSSGVYLLRLTSSHSTRIQKLIL